MSRTIINTLFRLLANRGMIAIGLCLLTAVSLAAKADTLLETYESRYAEVKQQVAAGKLSGDIATAAKEQRISLKQELFQIDARIKSLKLEAAEYSGSRQQQALDALVAESGRREHVIIKALQDLERMAGAQSPGAPLAVIPAAPSHASVTPSSEQTQIPSVRQSEQERSSLLTIESVPEDITTGEFE